MTAGVVLRVAVADAARIRELVGQVVTFPCRQVVGQALWDVQPKELPKLSGIAEVTNAADLDLHGDFGHVFGPTAELRWRRIDEQHYDVLILSDSPLDVPADGKALGEEGKTWVIEKRNLIAQQDANRVRVRVAQYLAPNGAVQFVSYREVLR